MIYPVSFVDSHFRFFADLQLLGCFQANMGIGCHLTLAHADKYLVTRYALFLGTE